MIVGSRRKELLQVFFKLFDIEELIIKEVSKSEIRGTVVYDSSDEYERQDFCLHLSEDEVPSQKVLDLLQIIHINDFIDGDKIIVSEDVLFERSGWKNRSEFSEALEAMYEIEVKMVDDGKEADSFFLHD